MRHARPLLLLLSMACTDDAAGLDGGVSDAANGADASAPVDAGPGPDAGADAGNAADAGPGCTPDPRHGEGQPALDLGWECFTVRPGGRIDFDLGLRRCCYTLQPYAGCETWSIEPPREAVSVDEDGTVTVGSDVPPGATFRVVATLSTGERAATEVTVISDATHPVQGRFSERQRLGCEEPVAFTPAEPVRELRFCGDRFEATYTPFEVYVDFWGRVDLDVETGDLRLTYQGGNISSIGLDLDGRATWADDELRLLDMRLQAPRSGEPEACGHVFGR